MKAVLIAILTDPEARAGDDPSAAPNPGFGHLREPVLFLANLLRGLNATVTASNTIDNQANLLGQNLFEPASVFSYFSPLYRLESGLPAPEFQIYSTQTAASRGNTVNTALYGKLDTTTTLNLAPFLPVRQQRQRLARLHQLRVSAPFHVVHARTGRGSRRQRADHRRRRACRRRSTWC